MQKELDELNDEIDKYKSQNLKIFNILHNNESYHKGKNNKNIKNNKNEENNVNLIPFNQDLNLKPKQSLNNSNILLKEFNEPTILHTEIINNKNQNLNDEQNVDKSSVLETQRKHKILNVETINNKHEGFDQYSFSWLTDDLKFNIEEGTKEVSIEIELENDGQFCWSKNENF